VGPERSAELLRLLATARLVTVTGPPGCGKSRLAAETLPAATDCPDRVWWVDLSAVVDAVGLARAVAACLGMAPPQSADPMALARDLALWLGPAPVLIVLDNADRVVEGCAVLAQTLVRDNEGARVIVTSRELLCVDGEMVWRPPLLALPPVGGPVNARHAGEALQLFLDRAEQAESGWVPTRQRLELAAQVCRRLDGLPLAIEAAAACLPHHPLEEIAARLDAPLLPLDEADQPGESRHATVSAALADSYNYLPPIEQALFRRLSVFPGGFSVRAAAAVCVGDVGGELMIAPDGLLDLLEQLVTKSLVQSDHAAPPGQRLRLLAVARDFGRRQLVSRGECEAMERRLAALRPGPDGNSGDGG
jgi:non-specific serine/threonine protein kinase